MYGIDKVETETHLAHNELNSDDFVLAAVAKSCVRVSDIWGEAREKEPN